MELKPALGKTAVDRLGSFFQIITQGMLRKPRFARAVIRAMASGEEGVAKTVASYQGRITGLLIASMRGVGRLGFTDASEKPVTEKEVKLALLLQQLWFASLVGWSAGLVGQNDVIAQIKDAAVLINRGIDTKGCKKVAHEPLPVPSLPQRLVPGRVLRRARKGGVLPLKYFGRDLVLFRGEDGVANLLDAHCAHLGAHLGHGGKVEGSCIRCPFHAWEFDGRGQCAEDPLFAQKPPPARAKVRPWHMREVNGLIMAWHHLQGEAPSWDIGRSSEYDHAEWTPYEKRRWKIRTHNQEMAENAVDSAHFHYVHGTVDHADEPRRRSMGHVLQVVSDTKMRTPMGKVTGQVEASATASATRSRASPGSSRPCSSAGTTAIDDDYVDVRFSFTVKKAADKDVTSTVGAAFMREIERQLGQDIPIWENKVYINPPLIVDGDGPHRALPALGEAVLFGGARRRGGGDFRRRRESLRGRARREESSSAPTCRAEGARGLVYEVTRDIRTADRPSCGRSRTGRRGRRSTGR